MYIEIQKKNVYRNTNSQNNCDRKENQLGRVTFLSSRCTIRLSDMTVWYQQKERNVNPWNTKKVHKSIYIFI